MALSISSLPSRVTGTLLLSGLLRIAAHDLDLLGLDVTLIVELEVHILNKERPNFIAEAIGIQMTLHGLLSATSPQPDALPFITLKFMRALTLSPNTSVMDLSN